MALIQRDVLDVNVVNGEVLCKVGIKGGDGYGDDVPVWNSDGFVSVPLRPDDDGVCMAVYENGVLPKVLALKDNRIKARQGEFKPGDRGIITKSAARIIVKDENASVNLMTENSDSGKIMLWQVNGADGEIVGYVGGPSGSTIMKIKHDSFSVVVKGGGSMLIDKDGFACSGNWCALNTGGGNLGTVGGATPPPGTNSILAGVAGPAGLPSASWTVAPT